jgi:hypothetical protein
VSRPVDRFTITAIAGAGLCAAAMALSPHAAAAPFKTGGYHCADSSGAVPAGAAAAGGGADAAACNAVDAVSLSGLPAGVPVLPGPPPVVVPPPLVPPLVPPVVPPLAPPLVPPLVPPLAPPLLPPLVPPVPLGAGAAAPLVSALDTAAIANANGLVPGKEAVAGPPPAGVGPDRGVPTQPGPSRTMAH